MQVLITKQDNKHLYKIYDHVGIKEAEFGYVLSAGKVTVPLFIENKDNYFWKKLSKEELEAMVAKEQNKVIDYDITKE